MKFKLLVSLMVWLASAPLLAGYALVTIGSLGAAPMHGTDLSGSPADPAFLACGWMAWLALALMNKGWLIDEPVSRYWPLAGIACALAALASFLEMAWEPLLMALPGVSFAVFLGAWHVRKHVPDR